MWSDQVASAKDLARHSTRTKGKAQEKMGGQHERVYWLETGVRAAEDRQRWRKNVADVSSGAPGGQVSKCYVGMVFKWNADVV